MAVPDTDLNLSLVGDIYINRPDPPSIFAGTTEALKPADILFGNFETPMCEPGYSPWPGKPMADNCMRMPLENLAAFKAAGFDAVGVASNHSGDFGAGALLRTLEVLDGAGIHHCGAGRTIEEAHQPAVVTKKGVSVAFLAYASVFMPGWEATRDGPGIAVVRVDTAYRPNPRVFEQPGSPAITVNFPDPVDRDRMIADVRAARARADVVVVSWHWGVSQGYGAVVPYQIEMGHAALDAGADLVFGHHPHMLQGVEIYGGKPLLYSLGNFALDLMKPTFGPETVIVCCRITGQGISRVSLLPCLIDETCVPRLVSGEGAARVMAALTRASADFGTRFREEGNEIVFE